MILDDLAFVPEGIELLLSLHDMIWAMVIQAMFSWDGHSTIMSQQRGFIMIHFASLCNEIEFLDEDRTIN